ncbi:MAG: DUF5615 family PIN-like protein [Nitrospirae bacterium]|nr:DUF5615 family PIN-like protein [Nitrospirota bacterium]
MKFLADMGVSMRVVEELRSCGHDVVHLREEGLHKLPDKDIFKKATHENRIILTFDLDFGEIIAFSEKATVSVIVFRLRNTRTPFVIERLNQVLAGTVASLEEGCIVTVEDARYRIRKLPIS